MYYVGIFLIIYISHAQAAWEMYSPLLIYNVLTINNKNRSMHVNVNAKLPSFSLHRITVVLTYPLPTHVYYK